MALLLKAGCWLGVLSLAWLPAPSIQANGDIPMPPRKFQAHLSAWLHFGCPQEKYMQNLAPWYTYFPDDPAMTSVPQGIVYPTWPSSFPPPQLQSAQQFSMPTSSAGQGFGNPGYFPGQPVSNFRTSVPNYWFAR